MVNLLIITCQCRLSCQISVQITVNKQQVINKKKTDITVSLDKLWPVVKDFRFLIVLNCYGVHVYCIYNLFFSYIIPLKPDTVFPPLELTAGWHTEQSNWASLPSLPETNEIYTGTHKNLKQSQETVLLTPSLILKYETSMVAATFMCKTFLYKVIIPVIAYLWAS